MLVLRCWWLKPLFIFVQKRKESQRQLHSANTEKKQAKGKEIGGGTDEAEDSLNMMWEGPGRFSSGNTQICNTRFKSFVFISDYSLNFYWSKILKQPVFCGHRKQVYIYISKSSLVLHLKLFVTQVYVLWVLLQNLSFNLWRSFSSCRSFCDYRGRSRREQGLPAHCRLGPSPMKKNMQQSRRQQRFQNLHIVVLNEKCVK